MLTCSVKLLVGRSVFYAVLSVFVLANQGCLGQKRLDFELVLPVGFSGEAEAYVDPSLTPSDEGVYTLVVKDKKVGVPGRLFKGPSGNPGIASYLFLSVRDESGRELAGRGRAAEKAQFINRWTALADGTPLDRYYLVVE